jgi:hypothetical protein
MKTMFGSVLFLSVLLLFCFSSGGARSNFVPASDERTAVLVGAGDIADCADLSGAEATAKLLEKTPGTVMAVGDLAYPGGTKEQFDNCYDKTWGRLKSRTRPAAGNHEFHSAGATPYFRTPADARLVQLRKNGCARTLPHTPLLVPSRIGTSRFSVPAAPTATTSP